jgi:hypothetical protein
LSRGRVNVHPSAKKKAQAKKKRRRFTIENTIHDNTPPPRIGRMKGRSPATEE